MNNIIKILLSVCMSMVSIAAQAEASQCSATNSPPLLGNIPLNQNIESMKQLSDMANDPALPHELQDLLPVSVAIRFYNLVKTGGAWDYKQSGNMGSAFEAAGNFHYGAVGSAAGFSEGALFFGAGVVSTVPGEGSAFPDTEFPFGDQLTDAKWIQQGIDYYNEVYVPNRPPGGVASGGQPSTHCDDGAPEPEGDVDIEEYIGIAIKEIQADGSVLWRMHYEDTTAGAASPDRREGKVTVEDIE